MYMLYCYNEIEDTYTLLTNCNNDPYFDSESEIKAAIEEDYREIDHEDGYNPMEYNIVNLSNGITSTYKAFYKTIVSIEEI